MVHMRFWRTLSWFTMMQEMPKTVTVPETLSGHAAEIWRSTFLSSYNGTCKKRSDRDACAAKIAWSAVKKQYKKGKEGKWVEKSILDYLLPERADTGMEEYPTPLGADSLIPTPARLSGKAAKVWDSAFQSALEESCANAVDPRRCASRKAWEEIQKKYRETDDGEFVEKAEADMEELTERREFSTKEREKLAKEGKALPWGGFPIENCDDVENAVQAIGRAKNRQQAINHIIKHAKRLGCMSKIPPKWLGKKEKSVFDEAVLAERRRLRQEQENYDQAILDAGYGDFIARRPDDISSVDWAALPMEKRTVKAEIWRRHCVRTYDQAVEDAIMSGWKAEKSPTRAGEFVFKAWISTPDGHQLVKAILVRKRDEDKWYLREVGRGASLSYAIRTAPDEVRR
jgi:cation transport regulator